MRLKILSLYTAAKETAPLQYMQLQTLKQRQYQICCQSPQVLMSMRGLCQRRTLLRL